MRTPLRQLIGTAGIILFCHSSAAAQLPHLEAGNIMVSGGASYSWYSGNLYGGSWSRLHLDPSVGFFPVRCLATGLLVNYTNINHWEDPSWSLNLGLMVRYYFSGLNWARKTAAGSTAAYGGLAFLRLITGGRDNPRFYYNTVSFEFGFNHMLTEEVGLFSGVTLDLDRFEAAEDDRAIEWRFETGLAVFLPPWKRKP